MEDYFRKRDLVKVIFYSIKVHFGVFGSFFRSWPGYMPFLNLGWYDDKAKRELEMSLNRMDRIFERKSLGKIKKSVRSLFKSLNWRPHLVGCIAILKMSESDQRSYCDILWLLCMKGSWVVPQLLATLSLVDPDFSDRIEKDEIKDNKDLMMEIDCLLHPEQIKEQGEGISHPWKKDIELLFNEGLLKKNNDKMDFKDVEDSDVLDD